MSTEPVKPSLGLPISWSRAASDRSPTSLGEIPPILSARAVDSEATFAPCWWSSSATPAESKMLFKVPFSEPKKSMILPTRARTAL